MLCPATRKTVLHTFSCPGKVLSFKLISVSSRLYWQFLLHLISAANNKLDNCQSSVTRICQLKESLAAFLFLMQKPINEYSSEITKQFINLNVGYYGIPLPFPDVSKRQVSSFLLTALQMIQNALVSVPLTSNDSHKSNHTYADMRHPALLQKCCSSRHTWLQPSRHNGLHKVVLFWISCARTTMVLERSHSPSSRWKSSFENTCMNVQSFGHRILLQREKDSSRGLSWFQLE